MNAFKNTLGIFAALVITAVLLAGIIFTVSEVSDYARHRSTAEIARRNAEQATYNKQQEAEEAQTRAEEAQHRTEELAQQAEQRHFTPYPAYIVGQWNLDCCTLYSDVIDQGLVIGTVSRGEQVQVLSDVHYDSVQVRTKHGLVGWIHPAKHLSLSK